MAETGAAKQTAPLPVEIKIHKDTVDPRSLTVTPGTLIQFHNESSINRVLHFDTLPAIALFFSPGAKVEFVAGADTPVPCEYYAGEGFARIKDDDGPYQVIVGGGVPGDRR